MEAMRELDTFPEDSTEMLINMMMDFTKLGKELILQQTRIKSTEDNSSIITLIGMIIALMTKMLKMLRMFMIMSTKIKKEADKVKVKARINNDIDIKTKITLLNEVTKKLIKKSIGCIKCRTDSHSTEECFNFRTKIPKFVTIFTENNSSDKIKDWLKSRNIIHTEVIEGNLTNIVDKVSKSRNEYTIITDSLGEHTRILNLLTKTDIEIMNIKYPNEVRIRVDKELESFKPVLSKTWFLKRYRIDIDDIAYPLNLRTMSTIHPTKTKLWKELTSEQKINLKERMLEARASKTIPNKKNIDSGSKLDEDNIKEMRNNKKAWKELFDIDVIIPSIIDDNTKLPDSNLNNKEDRVDKEVKKVNTTRKKKRKKKA